MRYFSGFSLYRESELFKDYIEAGEFKVAGFSHGAIEAIEFALNSKKRIDRVYLLSPAFFQDRDEKFKRVQLLSFKKNRDRYIEKFLKSCDRDFDFTNYLKVGTYEDLKALLYYRWDREKLNSLIERGVKIEIYLGELDEIINFKSTFEFFKEFGIIYLIKRGNHILRVKE